MQVEYDGKTAGPTQVESKISVPVEMDGSGNRCAAVDVESGEAGSYSADPKGFLPNV